MLVAKKTLPQEGIAKPLLRSSAWTRLTLPLRSSKVQRAVLSNDIAYYRQTLIGRARQGQVPLVALQRLQQLYTRIAAVQEGEQTRVAENLTAIHAELREALQAAPLEVLNKCFNKAIVKNAPRRKRLEASMLEAVANDYSYAIQQLQRKRAAARKICRNAAIHLRRKKAAVAEAKLAGNELARLRQPVSRQCYFYPVDEQVRRRYPVAYVPPPIALDKRAGSSKQVVGEDHNFVALQAKQDRQFLPNVHDAELLPYATVCVGLRIDETMMVAHHAGMDLYTHWLKPQPELPLSAFLPALADLDAMHENGIYLIDIKPENLAYDGRKIQFIDVDDRVHWHPERHPYLNCTPDWSDADLMQLAGESNARVCLQAADLSGMLHCLIGSTSPDPAFAHQVRNGGRYAAHPAQFQAWVEAFIKPEYHQHMILLLSEPRALAEQYIAAGTLLPKLSEMLRR